MPDYRAWMNTALQAKCLEDESRIGSRINAEARKQVASLLPKEKEEYS